MRISLSVLSIFIIILSFCSCKKNTDKTSACDPNAATTRTITSKKALVKLTATATYPVYLTEEGTIDTRLVPCNFPMGEYYQDGLQVIISGEVKATNLMAFGPCCFESFVITSITK